MSSNRWKELTGGLGVDYAFDAIGGSITAAQAVDAIGPAGHAVLVGIPAFSAKAEISPAQIVYAEKKISGTYYGSVRPNLDLAILADMYMDKKLNLDDMISRTYDFEEINEGVPFVDQRWCRARRDHVQTSPRELQRSDMTAKSSKLKTVRLQLPATAEDVAKLEIGTVIYLDGRIYTGREGVYQKVVGDGAGLPASLEELGNVNFHCSPAASVNPDGSFNMGAITATASFRFNKWLDDWFKISKCRILIGKGGMTSEVYKALPGAERGGLSDDRRLWHRRPTRSRYKDGRRGTLAGGAWHRAGDVGAGCRELRAIPR